MPYWNQADVFGFDPVQPSVDLGRVMAGVRDAWSVIRGPWYVIRDTWSVVRDT